MIAAITKIKEAEDASEAAIKKATETAQEIAKAAQTAARERRKTILDETRLQRDAMLNEARKKAEEACIPMEEASQREIEHTLHPDEKAFNSAVDALMDKLLQGR